MKMLKPFHIAITVALLLIFSGAGQCFADMDSFQCQYCATQKIESCAMQNDAMSMHEGMQTDQQKCDHMQLCHFMVESTDPFTVAPTSIVELVAVSPIGYLHNDPGKTIQTNLLSKHPPPSVHPTPLYTRYCSLLI